MMKPLTWTELRLDDLLSDPLVALVMRSDYVLPEVLRTQMYAMRRYLTQERSA
ncbi:hypothetical protein [Asticcacaulis sp. MM231]|jgi:hypothetical protein|uniref:hypothetical protein n=1 Tax=Asticcacaulis sp. MM231 TaxID=3157666 RepID=UPI0032D58116